MTDPIRCIVPVALTEAMAHLGPAFTAQTGLELQSTHMLNPEVPGHVAQGVAWDIALSNPVYIAEILEAGQAAPDSHRPFGRAPLAFAARGARGARACTYPGEIAALICEAGSIALTDRGTSGAQFRKLAQGLGIWDRVQARVIGLEGGGPMRALRAGDVDLAVLPLTNIAPVPLVHAVAICPAALEVHVDLSLCLRRGAPEAAQRLANWLTEPAREAELRALGAERFVLDAASPSAQGGTRAGAGP